MEIVAASQTHIDQLAELFNQYRVFYKQKSNINASKKFIEARILNKESVIFIALDNDGKELGFTQLYPTFSSVSLQSFYILNDLFVIKSARDRGIGAALLDKAKEFCIKTKAKGLALETAIDNPAQKLYERMDWEKDRDFIHYFWKNTNT